MSNIKYQINRINPIDVFAYTLLVAGLLLAAIVFLKFNFSAVWQLDAIFGVVIFYLIWGLVYHYAKGDLSKKLAAEYLLIAAICSLVGVLVFWL